MPHNVVYKGRCCMHVSLCDECNAGTLKWNFRCPLARELMLSLGLIDVSSKTLLKVKFLLHVVLMYACTTPECSPELHMHKDVMHRSLAPANLFFFNTNHLSTEACKAKASWQPVKHLPRRNASLLAHALHAAQMCTEKQQSMDPYRLCESSTQSHPKAPHPEVIQNKHIACVT